MKNPPVKLPAEAGSPLSGACMGEKVRLGFTEQASAQALVSWESEQALGKCEDESARALGGEALLEQAPESHVGCAACDRDATDGHGTGAAIVEMHVAGEHKAVAALDGDQ